MFKIMKLRLKLIIIHLGLHIPSLVEKNIINLLWSLSKSFLTFLFVISSINATIKIEARAESHI